MKAEYNLYYNEKKGYVFESVAAGRQSYAITYNKDFNILKENAKRQLVYNLKNGIISIINVGGKTINLYPKVEIDNWGDVTRIFFSREVIPELTHYLGLLNNNNEKYQALYTREAKEKMKKNWMNTSTKYYLVTKDGGLNVTDKQREKIEEIFESLK